MPRNSRKKKADPKIATGTRLRDATREKLAKMARSHNGAGVTLSAYIEIALEEHVARKERAAA